MICRGQKMHRVVIPTYTVAIFVGGDPRVAKSICEAFCFDIDLCVTIETCDYVFTGGDLAGVRVGLINYGRFPADPSRVMELAEALACRLIEGLGQESATLIAPDRTIWLSTRAEDVAALTERAKP